MSDPSIGLWEWAFVLAYCGYWVFLGWLILKIGGSDE